jgi:endoglycosylceramidase
VDVRVRRWTGLAIAAALLFAACTPNGPGRPGGPHGHGHGHDVRVERHGRWFVDGDGHTLGFRGVNFVQKFPPVSPESVGFGDDDAAFLAANGFNLVRLGVVFGAVMPQPGVVDQAYVDAIARTTRVLARHHIYVLLDVHQDGYGPLVRGNGFPEWATLTDGLPNPDVGFPDYYIRNPALQRAFENFWANKPGPDGVPLQQHYATALQAVAKTVRNEPYVIGYDLMNEPWPGADWAPCFTGCPDVERERLGAFEQRMSAALRAVDRHHLVFSEPFTLFNFGHADAAVPLPTTPDAALSFHVYAATPDDEPAVVEHALAVSAASNVPPLATEFGATNDPATISRIASRIEAGLVPWIFWAYDENLVIDKGAPPTAGNVRQAVLDALSRPYASATAGVPTHWSYDAATGALEFAYTPSPHGHGRTSIVLGSAYPNGYTVAVAGARVVSRPNASTLVVERARNATAVTVAVNRR